MRYERIVEISAPAEKVWEVLIDVERWPEWTASVSEVGRLSTGPFGLGSTVRIRQPRLPVMVWRVTVFEPGREFSWVAGQPGIRTLAVHRLEPRAGTDVGVSVLLGVTQSGPLAPLARLLSSGLTRRYVTMEANGLKRRSEAGWPGGQ